MLTQTQGIDRVSFFLDRQLIGRDETPEGKVYEVYLSPAARGLTRADWFKPHALQVQAYNLENEVTAQVKNVTPVARPVKMYVALTNLKPGDTVLVPPGSDPAPAGTTLTVTMRAYEYEWRCTGESAQSTPPGIAPVACTDALRRSVARMLLLWDNAAVSSLDLHATCWSVYAHFQTRSVWQERRGAHVRGPGDRQRWGYGQSAADDHDRAGHIVCGCNAPDDASG